jgi:hypothetical protein
MYLSDVERPAYRSLSVGARALLFEIRALYHGVNNGELFLSVRRACELLKHQEHQHRDGLVLGAA